MKVVFISARISSKMRTKLKMRVRKSILSGGQFS